MLKERKFGSVSSGSGRSLYVNRNNKKKRKKFIRMIIAWAIVIALAFLAIFGVVKLVKFCAGLVKDDFAFSHTTPENWTEYDSISTIKKDYAIGIQYPLINDATNKLIEKDAEELHDQLKDEIKEFERGKKENRAVYTVDYAVTQNTDTYVSLLYTLHRKNPIREIDDIQYKAKVYDIAAGEEVPAESIFTDAYASTVSDYVINTLSSDSNYSAEVSTTLFTENTSADINNFRNIGFSDNVMTVYFGAGEIFPTDMGAVTVDIPLRKMHPLMSINVPGYTPPLFDPEQPMIALTFDDGPLAENTTRILDTLESVGGRATFFIIGDRVEAQKEMVIRGDQLGCEYANHTWGHANLAKLSEDEIASQINQTDDALNAIIGKKTKFVRAPYATINETVFKVANKPFIGWNVDTMDWQTRDAEAIKSELLNNVKDGDIILMHDLYDSTATAVETAIPELVNRGFQLVTVSELMEAKEIELTPGKIYYSGRK